MMKVIGMATQEQVAKSKIRALAQGVKVWARTTVNPFAAPSPSNNCTAPGCLALPQKAWMRLSLRMQVAAMWSGWLYSPG